MKLQRHNGHYLSLLIKTTRVYTRSTYILRIIVVKSNMITMIALQYYNNIRFEQYVNRMYTQNARTKQLQGQDNRRVPSDGKKNSTRVSHVRPLHGLTHKIILLRTNVYCYIYIYNCKVVYALRIIVRLVRTQNAVQVPIYIKRRNRLIIWQIIENPKLCDKHR